MYSPSPFDPPAYESNYTGGYSAYERPYADDRGYVEEYSQDLPPPYDHTEEYDIDDEEPQDRYSGMNARVERRPMTEWSGDAPRRSNPKTNTSSSLSPFPQPSTYPHPSQDNIMPGYRPEFDQLRPRSKQERQHQDGEDDAFSLALSQVTTVTPEHLQLSLAEELILLKAGDKARFPKRDNFLDSICSCALLLDLVCQKRVGLDGTQTVNPRKLVLRVVDDTPTGSKLGDSALSNLKRKPKSPPTVQYWIKKASPDLCSAILWRLVQKGKLVFEPRALGADRFPVKSFKDLHEIRDRVMSVVERVVPNPPLKDLFLAFLYYLPSDESSKVFADRDDTTNEEAHIISRAVAYAIQEVNKASRSWM